MITEPTRRRSCLPLLAAIVLIGVASIADAATLDRLRAFVRETQTARAQFTQTVVDRNGRPMKSADGTFELSRPGKFRWNVEKPYKQLVVGDGQRVWVYDEDLNQVIVRNVGDALGGTPAALLSGNQEVERAFAWSDLPASDGLEWLGATPLAKDAAFTEIRIGFDAKGLAALEIVDAFGQKSLVRFTNLERNPKFAPERFRFVPPKDADVVGDVK
jgi:outer membrane lipoprotein carrier protein